MLTSGHVRDTCIEPLVSIRTLSWPAALAVFVSLVFRRPPVSGISRSCVKTKPIAAVLSRPQYTVDSALRRGWPWRWQTLESLRPDWSEPVWQCVPLALADAAPAVRRGLGLGCQDRHARGAAAASGARALPPHARVCLRRLLLHPFLVRRPRPLGRIPFPFLPSPLHIFLHLLLVSLLSSRLFLFLLPSSPPCPRFSRHFTLFFFTIVKSHSFLCHVLS